MKRVNINAQRLISTLFAAGELTVDDINAALRERMPLNTAIGYAADEHGHIYTVFVGTDRETKQVQRSRDGQRVRLNIRASKNQAAQNQATQTPGQAVGQAPTGAPVDPQLLQQVLAALGQTQAPQPQPQPQVQAAAPVQAPGVPTTDDDLPF